MEILEFLFLISCTGFLVVAGIAIAIWVKTPELDLPLGIKIREAIANEASTSEGYA